MASPAEKPNLPPWMIAQFDPRPERRASARLPVALLRLRPLRTLLVVPPSRLSRRSRRHRRDSRATCGGYLPRAAASRTHPFSVTYGAAMMPWAASCSWRRRCLGLAVLAKSFVPLALALPLMGGCAGDGVRSPCHYC
jgi:hypothetical protein